MTQTSDTTLLVFAIGYLLVQAGNVLLLVKINKQKSVYGISIDSQISLLLATIARCLWFTDTRLSTMWLACGEICLAVCLHSLIVYLCIKHKDMLQHEMPIYLRWYSVITVASILSYFMHPGKKGPYIVTQQMFVSFTMFTEALSLIS